MKRTYDGTTKRKIYRARKVPRITSGPAISSSRTLLKQHRLLRSFQSATLYFGGRYAFDGTAGNPVYTQLNANSLWDPVVAIGGHQPRGFDEIMFLYNKYRVRKATITIWCRNSSGSTLMAYVRARGPSTDGSLTDFREKLEDPNTIVKVNNPYDGTSITMTVDIAKFLGKDIKDDELEGDALANPDLLATFEIGFFPVDGTNVVNADMVYQIVYDTVFYEPKNPLIST